MKIFTKSIKEKFNGYSVILDTIKTDLKQAQFDSVLETP